VVDEVEVGLDGAAYAFLVVAGRLHRRLHLRDDGVAMLVEQCQIELQLARKVLVEHGLGDTGAFGDVVHRGRVVALGDEDLLGRREQLLTACRPGQPGRPSVRLGIARSRHHGYLRMSRITSMER
jgi:hypothetical protein